MREPYILTDHPDSAGRLSVTDEEATHLARVLRLRVGDRFIAFDGMGSGWRCEIDQVEKKAVTAQALEKLPPDPPERPIILAVGAVKGPRMEWAVEKAAELGVVEFVPLLSRYGVVDPGEGRNRRWNALALAAAKQSHRLGLMKIARPVDLSNWLATARPPFLLFDLPDEKGSVNDSKQPERPVNDLFLPPDALDSPITLIIGPEGGFSEVERDLLSESNIPVISLGNHPLRTETAVVAAVSVVRALLAKS